MRTKMLQDMLYKLPKSSEKVDLFKLANTLLKSGTLVSQPTAHPKFCLIIDAECCLNRLYGGYFADWISGGQWNRMAAFVTQLVTHLRENNIELVVFFRGSIEKHRLGEWNNTGRLQKDKINVIMQHVGRSHSAPHSRYWLPPVGLYSALRTILRHMNVSMVHTTHDHHQQVMRYCREYNYHGIMADAIDYIAFDPPRFFSANGVKLTFRGELVTVQYPLGELRQSLGVDVRQMAILFALLRSPDAQLTKLYAKAGIDTKKDKSHELIAKLATFLSSNPLPEDLKELVSYLLDDEKNGIKTKLQESIQYYLSGTADGHNKYKHLYPEFDLDSELRNGAEGDSNEVDIDASELAAESLVQENMVSSYKEITAIPSQQEKKGESAKRKQNGCAPSTSAAAIDFTADSSSQNTMPNVDEVSKANVDLKSMIPAEVVSAIHERFSRGFVSPYLFQIVMQGGIKLPLLLEDSTPNKREVPDIHSFFRPIRQSVYGLLFDSPAIPKKSAKSKGKECGVHVTEYVWNNDFKRFSGQRVAAVSFTPKVPSLKRLWLGKQANDSRSRLQVFLKCMRSDTSLILNTEVVPEHCLIAVAVLKYMMSASNKAPVLTKPELDSFLLTTVAPELVDTNYTDNLEVPVTTTRGVQLAAMFMAGVEMAFLANDACGSPIPWLMCCPWLFFNGTLFQYTLHRATVAQSLQDLCGNRYGLFSKIEAMRMAILEGLDVNFANNHSRFDAGMVGMSNGHGTGMSAFAPDYGMSSMTHKISTLGLSGGNANSSGRVGSGLAARSKKHLRAPTYKNVKKPKLLAKPAAGRELNVAQAMR